MINTNNYLDNYKLIILIIKKGIASKLLIKLRKVGVGGSTIMFGKGTAEKNIYEQILGVEYQPEKEIIFIAVDSSKADKILDTIIKEEHIDKPGHGIAIVVNLSKCAGIARLLNINLEERSR
ncbi:MAG: P-II family nitrogen regulator [Bacilli bacterium]